jgi:glycosyltransferase involved in cell wall biosynthesis
VVNALVTPEQWRAEPAAPGATPVAEITAQLRALDADVLDWGSVRSSRPASLLERVLGMSVALIVLTVLRMSRYRVVHVDNDAGLAVAMLSRVRRRPTTSLFVTAHRPRGRVQSLLLRLGAHRAVTAFFAFGDRVAQDLHACGVARSAVHLRPVPVDTEFWSVAAAGEIPVLPPYICSAGLEFRDYPTLVRASTGLGVDVRIAAASPYSRRRNTLNDVTLPPHVIPVDCDTAGLRSLYSGSELVVVTLDDVEFPAGLTTICEAMAMGKCVVVSRSIAQADAVSDRRSVLRADPSRATGGGLAAALLEQPTPDLTGPTGMYIAVGDADELHRVLRYLLDHPDLRAAFGRRGREVAERLFDVDVAARRMAELMTSAIPH